MAKKVTTKKANKATKETSEVLNETKKEEVLVDTESLENTDTIIDSVNKEIDDASQKIEEIMSVENPDTNAIGEILNNLTNKEKELDDVDKALDDLSKDKETLVEMFKHKNFNNFWNGSSYGW